MSFGKCSECHNHMSMEEFNAQIELRPNSERPILCFACIGVELEDYRISPLVDELVGALKNIKNRFDCVDDGNGFPNRGGLAWAMWSDAKTALAKAKEMKQ